MKKLFICLILLMSMSAFAGDPPDLEKKEEDKVTYLVQSETRVTKNVCFLFDCSTSMGREDRFDKAVKELNQVLSYPLDDGMVSLMGFKTDDETNGEQEFAHWPGVKEKDTPKNWARLPSVIALKSANKFINGVGCAGFTDIGPAIKEIFDKNKNLENITIILFSDGNNTFPNFKGKKPSEVVKLIKTLNKERAQRGKDNINIFVFGLSAEQNVKMLSAIAKAGNGSYLTTDTICKICAKQDKNIPEVQRTHRQQHVAWPKFRWGPRPVPFPRPFYQDIHPPFPVPVPDGVEKND